MARRRAGGRPVARDRRRARDTRTVGPPTARIAESLIKPFRKGRKETANRWASWVGPVSRIAASFVPRGSTRSLVATSQKTPLSVKRELYRREPMRTQRAKRQALEQSVPWRHSIP